MDRLDPHRRLAPRRAIDRDVHDEIAFHIEERVRELAAEGVDEAEARRRVLERFGDVERVEEECRGYAAQRAHGTTRRQAMDGWRRDLGYALRGMRRAPAFTATVIGTLALGIGASTAVFSVVEAVLLRPLPYPDADRLAVVWENDRATGTLREAASPADFFDWVERSRRFEALAMFTTSSRVLTRPSGAALRLAVAGVGSGVAGVLGVEAARGRTFLPGEDRPGGPAVALLADDFWRAELGADPDVVGRSLVLDGTAHEVVGVLPAGIDVPGFDTDLWLPLRQSPVGAARQQHFVRVLGRLAPGATFEGAQAEMSRIMAELEEEYPAANVNRGAFVEPLADVGRGDLRATLWVLLGAVVAVLLIACVNVANLLLARGAARVRELALLAAVGAGRREILRRYLMEGVVVAGLSAVAGVLVASLGVRLLLRLAPASLLELGEPGLHAPVLAFALAAAALVGLGFATLPALQARRFDLQAALRDGRSADAVARMPARRALVAAQLGLAVVLLVGATLLMGTLRNLQAVDPGFRPDDVLRAHLTIPADRYPSSMADYPDWPEVHALNREIVRTLAELPGVRSAALAYNHPLEAGFTNSFRIEGRPYDASQGEMTTRMVSPGYLETAGLRLVEGRFFDPGDDVASEPVVVLNREAAERHFPGEDPLGQRIAFWGTAWRTVIGVVENERVLGLTAEPPPAMYVSLFQSPQRGGQLSVMLRTEVPPMSLVPAVRAAVAGVDPDTPVYGAATMEETVAEAAARERFATLVLGAFAGVAVFLAILGVHGLLAYLVAQRGHELGVRMALGATRSAVTLGVLRQGAAMAVPGVALGVVGALASARLLEGLVWGVSPTSPAVYASVAVGLVLVALAASVLPARRAASVDPVEALRGE